MALLIPLFPSNNIRIRNSRFWAQNNFSDPNLEAKHILDLAKVLGLNIGDKENFLISTIAECETCD